MAQSGNMLRTASLALVALAAACGEGIDPSDPHYAELKEGNAWLKKLRAEDPDTGSVLAQECSKEVGFRVSKEGLLEMTRCMRRKYDEGVRA